MNDFYVTLPSSVKNPQFENTSSRFITQLPQVLQLEKDSHVVAVTDIIYPYSFVNVGRPLNYWIHFKNKDPIHVSFPAAQYSDLDHILNTLNDVKAPRIKRSAPLSFELEYGDAKRFKRDEDSDKALIDRVKQKLAQAAGDKPENDQLLIQVEEKLDALKENPLVQLVKEKLAKAKKDETLQKAKNADIVDQMKEKISEAGKDKKRQKTMNDAFVDNIKEKIVDIGKDERRAKVSNLALVDKVNEKLADSGQDKKRQKTMNDAFVDNIKEKIVDIGKDERRAKVSNLAFVDKVNEKLADSVQEEKRQKTRDDAFVQQVKEKIDASDVKKTSQQVEDKAVIEKVEKKLEQEKERLRDQKEKESDEAIKDKAFIDDVREKLEQEKERLNTQIKKNLVEEEEEKKRRSKESDQKNKEESVRVRNEEGREKKENEERNAQTERQEETGIENRTNDTDNKLVATVKSKLEEQRNRVFDEMRPLKKEEPLVEKVRQVLKTHSDSVQAKPEYHDLAQYIFDKPADRTMYDELKKNFERVKSKLQIVSVPNSQAYLRFTKVDGRIRIDFLDSDIMFVEFETACAYFLGFHDVFTRESMLAPSKVDYFGNVGTLYLYCDVVDPIIVGDSKNSLLSVIPCKGKYGEMIHHTIPHPRYLPIMNNTIDSIKIELLSEFAEPINFNWGSTIIVLHFKKI